MKRRKNILKSLTAVTIGAGVALAMHAQAQVTEPDSVKIKDGYPMGSMEQWLADPSAFAANPINLRRGSHPDRPGGVTYIFPDATTANTWWNGVGTAPDEIPDKAVAYIHWDLDNGSGSFPGIMAKSDVEEFKTQNCIMASGAVIPAELEGEPPIVKTCDNSQGSSKRFKMVVLKADVAIDLVFNIEAAPLTYSNYSSLPLFNGIEESARIYRILQKLGNGTGTDTANSGPITGTRVVGLYTQLGYGIGADFTPVANGSKIERGLGYELRPCLPDHFFNVLRDKPAVGINPCTGLTDAKGQNIPQEIWLQQEFATFSPKMFSTALDKRTTGVGGFWDKQPAGIINPETQSESTIKSGVAVNEHGFRGHTTANYHQLPLSQGMGAKLSIPGNVFGYLMHYGVLRDHDRETLAQGIYKDDDGDPATEGDLLAWWDGVNYRYGIDRDSDGEIDEDPFGLVADSDLAYMASRALDENRILTPPRFELAAIDDLAGLNVDTFVYLGRNYDVNSKPSFTIRMVVQSATSAGADGDAGNRPPEWSRNPAPPLSAYIPENDIAELSISIANAFDDINVTAVTSTSEDEAQSIIVVVKNLRTGESESIALNRDGKGFNFHGKLRTIASGNTDGDDNGVIHLLPGDTIEANYIDSALSNEGDSIAASASVTVASDDVYSSSGGGGGGWCAYNPNGKFDPVLPAMLFVSLAFIGLRRRHSDTL